jgi:hypothetical protein
MPLTALGKPAACQALSTCSGFWALGLNEFGWASMAVV